jgi:hypothetical protein
MIGERVLHVGRECRIGALKIAKERTVRQAVPGVIDNLKFDRDRTDTFWWNSDLSLSRGASTEQRGERQRREPASVSRRAVSFSATAAFTASMND